MVGRLEAGGRVAAAALLALGSLAPLEGPLVAVPPAVASVADASTACAMTVGTASTDPAFAADAARALAVGYATTDCMPDAQLLAAAEARAAIPMGSDTPTQAAVGGVLAGRSSSGSAAVESSGGLNGGGGGAIAPAAAPSPTATADAIPTPTETTTPAPTETTTLPTPSGTSGTDGESNDGTSSDSNSDGNEGSEPDSDGQLPDIQLPDTPLPDTPLPDTPLPDTPLPDNTADCTGTGSVTATNTDSTTAADSPTTAADGTTTAACALQWGTATGVEDFDGDLTTNWGVYDGPGHDGKGIRSPKAMSVTNGVLTISGDANGTTGGMAWKLGRSKYGRWEARVRSPEADPSYNAVMLLWPDAENWPEGGEVDFMEIGDETRQKADFFLHYGANNRQLHGEVQIDATQWHNWAVEWSPQKITAYVDGKEWYSTTQVSALPPDSMHLTLQLDWFPKGGSVQPSTMQVDWVRYYPIDGSGDPGTIVDSQGTTSGTGATLARIAGSAEPATTGGSTTGDGAGGGSDGATSSAEKTVTVTVDPTTPAPSSPAGTATSATTSITEPEPAAVGGSAGNAADTAVPADLDENGVGTSAAPGTSE